MFLNGILFLFLPIIITHERNRRGAVRSTSDTCMGNVHPVSPTIDFLDRNVLIRTLQMAEKTSAEEELRDEKSARS